MSGDDRGIVVFVASVAPPPPEGSYLTVILAEPTLLCALPARSFA